MRITRLSSPLIVIFPLDMTIRPFIEKLHAYAEEDVRNVERKATVKCPNHLIRLK